MEELKVVVQQETGKVAWNFDSLKNALAAMTDDYKNVVYSDDMIVTARGDVAMLRKLRTQVEDKRLEVRRKCLEPYSVIEKQAKELTALIDEPISSISKQVKDYDTAQRQARKKEVLEYFDEQAGILPKSIAERLKAKIYDSKWENATASKKAWKDTIRKGVADTAAELKLVEDTDEDFRDAVLEEYGRDLSLHNALMKAEELRKQKERVLENERKRKEEEARRMEERLRREEREKAEKEAARTADEAEKPGIGGADVHRSDAAVPGNIGEGRFDRPVPNNVRDDGRAGQGDGTKTYRLRFTGTESALRKVLGYATYVGAKCEVE